MALWRGGASGADVWLRARPLTVDGAFAILLAVVLGLPSATMLWSSELPSSWVLLGTTAVIVGHLTVALRRRAPVGAYVVCCLAMLVLVLGPDLVPPRMERGLYPQPLILLPSALVFPVLLDAVAAYGRRPFPVVALLPAVVGAGVTTIRLWRSDQWWHAAGASPTGRIDDGWLLFVIVTMFGAVLAPWGLGQLRRVRTAYVGSLEDLARHVEADRAERAARAAAAERARIAREMHDVVAHSLAVIVRQAEGGRYAASADPVLAAQVLDTVATTGRTALTDMRAVLDALHDGGPGARGEPQPTIDDIAVLVDRARHAGLDVVLRVTGAARALDRTTSLAAYRVVQEALTNVLKHAGPGVSAEVHLGWAEDGLQLAIVDAGRTPTGDDHEPGYGLVGMRERVTLAGGELEVGRRTGGGFAVQVRLPTNGPLHNPEVAP